MYVFSTTQHDTCLLRLPLIARHLAAILQVKLMPTIRLPGMVGARIPRKTLIRKSITHATPHHATPHHPTVHGARPHHTAPHHTTPPQTNPHCTTPHRHQRQPHTTPHHRIPTYIYIYIYICKVCIYIYILLWVAFRFAPHFWLQEPFSNSQHIHKCTCCVFLQLSV